MRYKLLIGGVVLMGLIAFLSEKLSASRQPQQSPGSIYDFKIASLEGKEIDFNTYRGKYLLIVNTASKCGYTYQYEDLENLHNLHGDKVAVLGFPANNFLWQEPGSDKEIAEFCQRNYGVSFQMFSKISVRGKDQHPLYAWLEKRSGKKPSWNFCKYLVDKSGNMIGFYPPTVKPMDKEILDKIAP